jgi:hypothetical protein
MWEKRMEMADAHKTLPPPVLSFINHRHNGSPYADV